MTIKYRSIFTLVLAVSFSLPSALAQGLPPTNMGKFVHQPGDGQYQPQAQKERHGSSGYLDVTGCEDHRAEVARQQVVTTGPAYILAPPPPPGPDVSIEPIACEEPVPPPGFPPMPLGLDLPVSMGVNSAVGGSWSNRSRGGGAPAASGGAAQSTGSHQHYNHYDPGAFIPKRNNNPADDGGGGGDAGYGDGGSLGGDPGITRVTSPAVSSGGGGGEVVHSGYKVRTPPPIMRTDTFSTSTNGGTGKGAMSAPTNVGGRGGRNSKAPGLDDSQDAAAASAPETPTTTGVFQSQSEDLTLPDDEYASANFKNGKNGRVLKQTMRRGKQLGRQMLRQTGVPIGF
ncbi:MAG: hypothetical protein K2X27_20205 [Candidatus Obscuribacterales bacterium]|nr:hypothetical protein [Candidatus Obscuribacterales bacterium]